MWIDWFIYTHGSGYTIQERMCASLVPQALPALLCETEIALAWVRI